jgi:hypothetical protein
MGTGDAAFLRQNHTIVNGTTVALSLYIKQVSGTTAFLDISDKKSVPDITPTTSWVKYESTTTWNTSNPFIDLEFRGANGVAEVLIWGAQLETGAVATSYIPTVASTVARTADDISLASASSLIGQGTGVMYFEFSQLAQVSLTTLQNDANSNGIQIYRSGTDEVGIYVRTGGVDRIVTTTGDAFVVGSPNKVAIAYAVNDITIYLNGVKIYENLSTPPAIPTLNVVSFAGYSGVTLTQTSVLRSFALFPTRLTNTQLETLTTL